MGFADAKGITVASGFKLQAKALLDAREVVDTIEDRDELVTLNAVTVGLKVYVKETKILYVYNGTGWDELSKGSGYTHPTTPGNKHIPSGGAQGKVLGWKADGEAQWVDDENTTYSPFKGATAEAAGGAGLVPAPGMGSQSKFLSGDGTWQTPKGTEYGDATTEKSGLMSATDKKKLDGVDEGANKYTHPSTHPASIITQDATHRFVSDEEKEKWNGKLEIYFASELPEEAPAGSICFLV